MEETDEKSIRWNYYRRLAKILRTNRYTQDEAETILTDNSHTNNHSTIIDILEIVYKNKKLLKGLDTYISIGTPVVEIPVTKESTSADN